MINKLTFPDVTNHANQTAIEAMAARNILNGKSGGVFDPDASMTRAEFAKTVVCALGMEPKENGRFTDVTPGAWYAGYAGAASDVGIITGVGNNQFNPMGTITRQEAAVMVARAAKLCGMDTAMDDAAARDVLAAFGDYIKSDSWARPSLAFCYQNGILDDSELNILPKTAIKRCEVSQMLYNLLGKAKLL